MIGPNIVIDPYHYVFSKTLPSHIKDMWEDRELVLAVLKGQSIEHSSVTSKVYNWTKKITGGSAAAVFIVFAFILANFICWFVLLGQLIVKWSHLPTWCKWTALVLLITGFVVPGLAIAGVIMVSIVLEKQKTAREEALAAGPQQQVVTAVPAATSPRRKGQKKKTSRSRSRKQ